MDDESSGKQKENQEPDPTYEEKMVGIFSPENNGLEYKKIGEKLILLLSEISLKLLILVMQLKL